MQNRNEMKLVVEAVRGPGYRGDIAIDDISLKEGECRKYNPLQLIIFHANVAISYA